MLRNLVRGFEREINGFCPRRYLTEATADWLRMSQLELEPLTANTPQLSV